MPAKILSTISMLILCFVLLPTNRPCQELAASSEEAITITYDFPKPRVGAPQQIPLLENTRAITEGYVSVTMEGLSQWSEPGFPVLPFKIARLLLPYGFDVDRITVTCGSKIMLPGSYLVEPGQEPVPLSCEGPVEATPPNPKVYDSSDPFPGKLHSDAMVQNKLGYRISLVNLHPVEYIPKQGQLSYYESLTVQVTLRRAAGAEGKQQRVRHLAKDEDVVREMVDNPETISSYRRAQSSLNAFSLLDPADYEYVIITSEALAGISDTPYNFQALANEKISRGITATIVTTEWIYAHYDGTRPDGGTDNQTRIRNFIIDAYNTWGTRYVLLGGDGDGGENGDNIIPCRLLAGFPADMYYACLDGDFDADRDGIYGEGEDQVDLFAEVYVGRAPVDSQVEVQNFVRKTLAYQNTPATDENLRKVWMVGERLWTTPNSCGGYFKDLVKEGSSAWGRNTTDFENSPYARCFDVSTLYERDRPPYFFWPKEEIISIINDNVHLINHVGHGDNYYIMKLFIQDVERLNNTGLYFIGYTVGCMVGAFDNFRTNGVYGEDCIAEHFVTADCGAVAFIANSRAGFLGPGVAYDREFWDAVLGEEIFNIGIAYQDAKEDLGSDAYCYQITLFGDPELTIKGFPMIAYQSHEIDDGLGGDGYAEPGESIRMPVTVKNIAADTTYFGVNATLTATVRADTTIFSEDFEGSWPGEWEVGDWNSNSGEDYWGQTDYRAYRSNFSVYCAEVSDVSGQCYDNNMQAYMIRDVNLGMCYSATLSYKWAVETGGDDGLHVGYFDGSDNSWHWMKRYHGPPVRRWEWDSIDVPPTATKVGFLFYSDGSLRLEGAYIDSVTLTGHYSPPEPYPDPYINITDDNEEYGDIPPSGVAPSLGAYDFAIHPDYPGSLVTFSLDIAASNGGPWIDSFNVRLGPPPNAPPEVSNVGAYQRLDGLGIVWICYDVWDNEQSTVHISLEYRDPSGSWHACTNAAGHVGSDVGIGMGKSIEWNAKAQLGNVDISGLRVRVTADDGAGGVDRDEYWWTFDLDTILPTITGKSPVGSNVPVDSSITVTVSEPLGLWEAFSVSPDVPGLRWFDPGTLTFTIYPFFNLAYGTKYTVTICGTSTDKAGNSLDGNGNGIAEGSPVDDYTWSFGTEAAGGGGGCFIATAAYDTPMAEEIQILREFRDGYLLTNPLGEALVSLYYRLSPPIAEFIVQHSMLKPIIRAALVPAIAMSTVVINTAPAEKIAIISLLVLVSVSLTVWAMRRRSQGPEYT